MFSRNRLKRVLLDQLNETHSFEIPPGMVETEMESIWEQLEKARLEERLEDADKEKPEEELRAKYGEIASRRVRLGLLLAEVGRVNNIEVSAEEVNQAMLQEVRKYPGQERQVMEYFQKNQQAMAGIRAPIFEDKVIDFILEMAEVTDRSVTPEELMADPEEEAPKEAKKPAAKKKRPAAKKKAKDADDSDKPSEDS
jgi:trigger factor